MNTKSICLTFLLFLASFSLAQTPEEAAPQEIADDTNPTKAVLFSVREEYYKLSSNSWNNAVIFRGDRAVLERYKTLRPKGMIFRIDAPIMTSFRSDHTRTGLGDVYFQSLLFPHLGKTFLFAVGSGLLIPTATDSSLGNGKFQIAPVVGTMWTFPRKRGFMGGYFLMKFQDYYSFAGNSSRPDIHYFQFTPTLLYRIDRKNWIMIDTEMKTNWLQDNRTVFRSGIQFGRMFNRKVGFWIKPEIPWGNNRDLDWVLKFTMVLADVR